MNKLDELGLSVGHVRDEIRALEQGLSFENAVEIAKNIPKENWKYGPDGQKYKALYKFESGVHVDVEIDFGSGLCSEGPSLTIFAYACVNNRVYIISPDLKLHVTF